MDIRAAELALIEQIKTTGAKAEAFPEDPENYVPAHASLVHLVRYEGATFTEPVPNRKGAIVQDTRREFVVVSVYKHLTTVKGLYEHLELLRGALTGFTIPAVPQATALYPVRQNLIREVRGTWYYQTVVAMTHPETEDV